MEEAPYQVASIRQFAGVSLTKDGLPDKTTIPHLRPCWRNTTWPKSLNAESAREGLFLRQEMIMDVTIIHLPSSTKNCGKAPMHPEMHSTSKGWLYYFGIKTFVCCRR